MLSERGKSTLSIAILTYLYFIRKSSRITYVWMKNYRPSLLTVPYSNYYILDRINFKSLNILSLSASFCDLLRTNLFKLSFRNCLSYSIIYWNWNWYYWPNISRILRKGRAMDKCLSIPYFSSAIYSSLLLWFVLRIYPDR